jgi:transcription initiation factor TFIIF subunit alpha
LSANVFDTRDEKEYEEEERERKRLAAMRRKEGKKTAKALRNRENNHTYDSDSDENPYASSVCIPSFPTCDTNSCSLRKRMKRSWSARRKRRRSRKRRRRRKRRGRRPRLPLLRNRRRNWSLPPAHRSPSPRYHPRRPPNLPESPSTRRPLTTLSVPDPTNFPSPETKKPARSPRSRK